MSLAEQFASWISVSSRYWLFNWVALALCLAVTFSPVLLGGRRLVDTLFSRAACHRWLYLGTLAVMLFVFRWPALFEPKYFNPDEAQAITEAITLLHDPIYPRAIMGGDRMLQAYLLALPGLFGIDLTYFVSRFLGLALFWIASLAVYFAVRPVSGDIAARIATSASTVCYAMGVTRDYLSHSTELITLPLIAVSCFLILRLSRIPIEKYRPTLFLLGLALGAVPFAKIQAVPIALAITALAYLWVLYLDDNAEGQRIKLAAVLTAGGMTLPLFGLVVYLACGGLGEHYRIMTSGFGAYIDQGGTFIENVQLYRGWRGEREWGHERLIMGTLAYAAFIMPAWLIRKRRWLDRPWWALVVAYSVLIASWYSLAAPARPFTHYLLHTLIPFSLFAGILIARLPAPPSSGDETTDEDEDEGGWGEEPAPAPEDAWENDWETGTEPAWRRTGQPEPKPAAHQAWTADPAETPAANAVEAAPAIATRRRIPWSHFAAVAFLLVPQLTLPFDPRFEETDRKRVIASILPDILKYKPMKASQMVNKLKAPGTSMTVWGWQSDYHVETQLPIGMRIPITYFLIEDLALRDLFRKRNLEAFVNENPAFFIDAVAPVSFFYQDREKQGHEIFPELAEFVRSNYSLLAEPDGVRVYISDGHAKKILAEQEAGLREGILTPLPPR